MTLQEYCTVQENLHLLREWDREKNAGLSPENLSVTSHKRIFWRCARGHQWNTELKDRTQAGRGCPYCAGRLPILGETDLATVAPALAAEWNPEKNGEKRPEDFTAGSEQKVWWRCSEGHEWQATVENRTVKGNRCPYCAGKKAWPGYNDLATLYPGLMDEWHPTLNSDMDPTKLRPGAKKRVYWRCREGHVWDAYLYSRTGKRQAGCPFCAGNAKKRR
ncbi:MAG: zinc-ribbon domain-containing protein [Muribaculaceae bacterium]|nr:zinc-ribbon domain-containing protein [Muribaculaceae bacterium]MCM1492275.1 zinc-ribbon domain-containing protein [Muribaculaceae bacterium]